MGSGVLRLSLAPLVRARDREIRQQDRMNDYFALGRTGEFIDHQTDTPCHIGWTAPPRSMPRRISAVLFVAGYVWNVGANPQAAAFFL